MKQQFSTLEQATTFIEKCNAILGYPNEQNGTLTYAIPQEVIENEVVTGYEVEVTSELNDILVEMAVKQILNETLS